MQISDGDDLDNKKLPMNRKFFVGRLVGIEPTLEVPQTPVITISP